ncbi:hypothetical protein ABFS83_07G034100 [Erythranthe nasuta]
MEAKYAVFLISALFLLASAKGSFEGDCRTSFKNVGCPNESACFYKCRVCSQGHGEIYSRCRRADNLCICTFSKGAPCPPFPGCPLVPPTP